MATTVYTNPEVKVLTHQMTQEQTGRVYFPSLRLSESNNQQEVKEWLESAEIQFEQKDLKLYGDGSIRVYLKAPQPEYNRLARKYRYHQTW
ncbi:MAG: hypothetical protein WBB28_20355 [Crinalium sp.]